MRLQGKNTIVTGGAHGIGRAIAQRFAEEGATVLIADVDESAAETAAQEISARGGRCRSVRCDVSSASEVKAAVAAALKTAPRMDVLCNNAAYLSGQWHNAAGASEEEWEKSFRISVLGAQYFIREVLPAMSKQQGGSIINISSVQGLVAGRDSAAYTTMKHALIGLTRSVAADFGQYNVRCNALCPGAITTRISPAPGTELHQRQISQTFLRRVGGPREVANAALFFACDESSYVTGAVLAVDGGWTAI